MPHKNLGPMTRDQVVARARSAIGKGIVYELGSGGRDPWAPMPSGAGLACDCSGFAAWALGVDRYLRNDELPDAPDYEWFETSNIVRDSREPGGIVSEVFWQDALPGDMLVWGDSRGSDGRKHQGHVGIVASLGPTGPETVVHCSMGNWKKFGEAVRETEVTLFLNNHAVVARASWVV
jgi:cell wall-associated NlpC family hydrolase